MALVSIQELYVEVSTSTPVVSAISAVNPENTFIILAGMTRASGLDEWRRTMASVQLSANGEAVAITVPVDDSGNTNIYKLYIIEDDECTVQHGFETDYGCTGQHGFETNYGNFPITISAVNVDNTFVLTNFGGDAGGNNTSNEALYVYLSDSSTVNVAKVGLVFSEKISYQVVENPNWTVQSISGTFTSATTSATIAIPTAVDASKSWVYGRYYINTNDAIMSASSLWNYQLADDGSNINLFRDTADSGVEWKYQFYVIEANNLRVQRGHVSIGAETGNSATISTSVEMSASFLSPGALGGFNIQTSASAGTSNKIPSRCKTITELVDSTTVSAYRVGTNNDDIVSYFEVIEYFTSATPTPSGLFTIKTFNVSENIICSGTSAVLNWDISGTNNFIATITPLGYSAQSELFPISPTIGEISANYTYNNLTSATFSGHSIDEGENRIFVVIFAGENDNDATGSSAQPISCKWGTKNMNFAVSANVGTSSSYNNTLAAWYLLCEDEEIPIAGSAENIVITFSGPYATSVTNTGFGIASFTIHNVEQIAPKFTNSASIVSANSIANSISADQGDVIIQSFINGYGTAGYEFDFNNNQQYINSAVISGTTNVAALTLNGYLVASANNLYNLSASSTSASVRNASIAFTFESLDNNILSGTSSVTPSATTEYILSVYDDDEIIPITESSVVVWVNQIPIVNTFESNLTTIDIGQSATLNWEIEKPDCWCSASVVPTSSWEIDRLYRLPISAGNFITSAETNIPMYYNLANISANNDFWSNIETNGGDLLITLSDGTTRVPLEIVYLSGSNKTGEIYFKDPGPLKTSASNIYYIYFGKAGATQPDVSATYGRNDVWSNNYLAVYHLHNTSESTGKASILTNNGATQTSSSYYDFDGTSDYMSFSGVSFTSLQNMTFESFIKVDNTGNNPYGIVVRARNNGEGIPATGPGIRTSNEIEYHWKDQGNTYTYDPNKVVPTDRFFYYSWRINSTSAICRVSGTDTTNAVTHNAITCTPAVVWRIGDDPTYNRFFKGYIDEVRLMSATVSESWTTIQEKMFSANNVFWNSGFIEEKTTDTQTYTSYVSACKSSSIIISANDEIIVSAVEYDFDRLYRLKIILDKNEVFTNEVGFPLTFNLANLSGATTSSSLLSPFWENIQSDGGDLIVSDISGNQLPLEIGYIDTANKKGTIYFKSINALNISSDSLDNEFYLYWGTISGTTTQPVTSSVYGSESVWDDNYVGVWHLDETSGTTIYDSTQYDNNGNITGTLSSTNTPVGRGLFIGFSSTYINVPNDLEFNTSAVTIEFLVKTSEYSTNYPSIIMQQNSISDRAFYASIISGGLAWYGSSLGGWSIENSVSANNNGNWYSYAGRGQEGSSATLHVDTNLIGTNIGVTEISGGTADLFIGANWFSETYGVAEVRYSNIMRSENWVKTTNNLNINNSRIWTIGTPELNLLTGSIVVSPTSATTYYLIVSNCCGQVIAQITLNIASIDIKILRDVLRGVARGILRGVL